MAKSSMIMIFWKIKPIKIEPTERHALGLAVEEHSGGCPYNDCLHQRFWAKCRRSIYQWHSCTGGILVRFRYILDG